MNFLEQFLKIIIVTILIIMTIIVAVQIGSRYVLNTPLGWSGEVTRYLFIYLTFLSASVGIRRNIHIGVDILTERLTGLPKKILEQIVNIILILFLLLLFYFGTNLAIDNWNQASPSLGLPIGIFYAAIPISSLMSLLFVLENMFKGKWEGDANI